MDPPSRRLDAPDKDTLIGLGNVAPGTAREKIARDVMDALLDLAFVLRCAWTARRNEKAVVLGALAIGALHDRVVEHRLADRRLEIVDDDAVRHAAEPLKGPSMAAQPRRHVLVEHELDVAVAAEREGHDERPRFAAGAAPRVVHQTGVAEVHLRFVTGGRFDPHDRVGRARLEPAHEAVHRLIRAGEPAFLTQDLVDGPTLDTVLPQIDDPLAKPLDTRRCGRGADHGQRGGQSQLQRRSVRQRLRQEPLARGPLVVLAHGLPTDVQVPGNAPVPLAELQPAKNLANVQHVRSPSCHARPPRKEEQYATEWSPASEAAGGPRSGGNA
jgi:hypothetical protein